MTTIVTEVLPAEVLPKPREETQTRRQPPYAVVLHNDDFNSFGFVIEVLQKVFGYHFLKAFWLTVKVHFTKRGIIWSGTLEVAELKADQVRSCGPDPNGKPKALPLTVTVEPLPG